MALPGNVGEIQKADAVRMFAPHMIWKDAAMGLLVDGCKAMKRVLASYS